MKNKKTLRENNLNNGDIFTLKNINFRLKDSKKIRPKSILKIDRPIYKN